MKTSDIARMMSAGLRLSLRTPAGAARVRTVSAAPGGMVFDDYIPRGKAARTLILLHGCCASGKDDPRLCHLARCLSAAGFRCVVPMLGGLSAFQWHAGDIADLADLIARLSHGQKPRIGIIGFSYGASQGLVAAARAGISERLAFIVSLGAYYSLHDLSLRHLSLMETPPEKDRADEEAMKNRLYLRLAMTRRHAESIPLSKALAAELDDQLRRYCACGPDEKLRSCPDYFGGDDIFRMERTRLDKEALERFSPAGRLHALECPVALLHDAGDYLVPADHSRQIARELEAEGKTCELLITDLFHHVDVNQRIGRSGMYRALGQFSAIPRLLFSRFHS